MNLNKKLLVAAVAGTLSLGAGAVELYNKDGKSFSILATASVGVVVADGKGYKYDAANAPTMVNQSSTSLRGSQFSSNRLAFAGSADLGGGMSSSFHLEGSIGVDDGSIASAASGQGSADNNTISSNTGFQFNRRATASVAGAFGEVRLGRDYVPDFWNTTIFDPFGTNGIGASLAGGYFASASLVSGAYATGVRASNSIGYHLPAGLPVYGQLMVAYGEKVKGANTQATTATAAALENNGNYAGARFGTAAIPGMNIALATGTTTRAAGAADGATVAATAAMGDMTRTNLGASYKAGSLTVSVVVDESKEKASIIRPTLETKITSQLLGFNYDVGSGNVLLAWSKADGDNVPLSVYGLNATATAYAIDNRGAKGVGVTRMAVGYNHKFATDLLGFVHYSVTSDSNGSGLASNGGITAAKDESVTALSMGLDYKF